MTYAGKVDELVLPRTSCLTVIVHNINTFVTESTLELSVTVRFIFGIIVGNMLLHNRASNKKYVFCMDAASFMQ
jgi:hypothetical protein